jgi:hypothetical protein
MSIETLFQLSNLTTLPFWLLMIFAPHWRVTKRVTGWVWICVPAVLIYAALVLPQAAQILPSVANPQLADIARLLGTPAGTTIAWAHFLAFDLFVGRWVYQDSRDRGISALLSGPVLFFVLMLGPVGFLLHLLVRTAFARFGPKPV